MSRHGKKTVAGRKSFLARMPDRPLIRWPFWAFEAGLVALFWLIARFMPVETASRFGGRILEVLGPRADRHRHVLRNLSIALPQRNERDVGDLARGVWRNFGQVMAEYAHMGEICDRGPRGRVELVRAGDLDCFNGSGRPVIFVGAHMANWELSAGIVAAHGVPLTVVYTPEKNPFVARMLQRRREALGCGFVSKLDGLRPLMRELAKGRSIGLLIDRRNDQGEILPFFGLDTTLTFSPARLALKYGYQMVPTQIERVGPARFRVTTHSPVEPDQSNASDDEKVRQMMTKVNAIFESWIRNQPQDWFCSKRMWPKAALARYDAAQKTV